VNWNRIEIEEEKNSHVLQKIM